MSGAGLLDEPAGPTSLFGRAVGRQVSQKVGGTTRTRYTKEMRVSVEGATLLLERLAGDMWARKILEDRQYLWRRLHRWTQQQGVPINANTATLFVMATQVAKSGQLGYAKTLSAIFGRMGWDNQPLRSVVSALRGTGAAVAEDQADPISKELLLRWVQRQEAGVRLAALVAWKTASRWGEASVLRSVQFIAVSAEEVIIDWSQVPKGCRRNPYKPSRFTVVLGDLTGQIAALVKLLTPFDMVTKMTTDALDRTWGADSMMRGYTAHSIKRGAMTVLFKVMASGVDIPEELVDRLAKHSNDKGMSGMTVRYGGDYCAMARALKTGAVTRYL